MTPFPSKDRKAFNGLALAIVRGIRGQSGGIVLTAKSDGMEGTHTIIRLQTG
jgi:beta-galactosidase